jgi:hypothetical protein
MGEPGVAWTARPDDPLQVQPVDRDMSWIPSGTGADKHNPEEPPIHRDDGRSPECFTPAANPDVRKSNDTADNVTPADIAPDTKDCPHGCRSAWQTAVTHERRWP